MLAFMRKHQKYFYVLITFVIVVSFSFFGTYSTLAGNSIHERVAFTTVAGEQIPRSELEEMAQFIGTDNDDKKIFGGAWGPNFLNDGVVRKDFLENGLGLLLIEAYKDKLQEDFKHRFAKEVRYKSYVHPQVPFLSSQNAWRYFAPMIVANLEMLQQASDVMSADALQARINLFIMERQFPAPYLRQILRYQEKQYGWAQHDEALDYQDFSLFGYHTLDDWFGPRFNRMVAEFIFNAAAIAEQKGYRVSKEEAYAELLRNSEISFKENQNNPQIGVATSGEYLDQQLYRMRLDKSKATKLWQKVLLFRRLFDDVGQSVFVDPVAYQSFNRFANEVATGDLFRLPNALRFSDFKTLQQFETYLDAVTKRNKDEKNILLLPQNFLSVEDVMKKRPELVRKRYELALSSTSKNALQAKVSVKDTFGWEIEEKNWAAITTQFPEMGLKKGSTKEERIVALDLLDSQTRARLDRFAREQIVKAHPEWLNEALAQAPQETKSISLSLKGKSPNFIGLEEGGELIKLLDKAEIGKEDPALKQVSFDNDHYYRITVLERSPNFEILTFQEAKDTPILDEILDHALEVHYVQIRSQDTASYQAPDSSWKPLSQVRDKVALAYFNKLLDAIQSKLKGRGEQFKNIEGERLAAYRFIGEGDELLKKLEKDSKQAEILTVSQEKEAPALIEQFKWIKTPLHLARKAEHSLAESEELFKQTPQSWSKVVPAANGDLYFAFVKEKSFEEGAKEFQQEQVLRARALLGSDAERTYLHQLIPFLKEKQAISFDYLNAGQEDSIEPTSKSDDV